MDTTMPLRAGSRTQLGRPDTGTIWVIATGGGLTAAVICALALTSESVEQPALSAALACWLVVPYILAGLIAWRRRPEIRMGQLMIMAGFMSAPNFLVWSANDLLFTIGIATQFLPPVLFLHVYLAFPDGRLGSSAERAVVAAAYGVAALSVPALFLGQDDERNVLGVLHRPEQAELVQKAQLLLVSVLTVMGIVLLIRRRLRDGRPLRASFGYVVDAFALALLSTAFLLMTGFFELSAYQQSIRMVTFWAIGLAPTVFLAGLLQARLGRASVGELMIGLGDNPGPGELQQAVIRALRDPSATLAFWLPEFDSYADVDGHEVDLDADPRRSAVPILGAGSAVAMLLHDPALDDESELVAAVAAAVGMTIQNARLQVELRARLEELRGSRVRILEAEQRERRRLERNLHDGAQQRLIALSMELGELEERVAADAELRARVEAARQEVTSSLAELRDIANGIHPSAVSDHGLAVALESLATRAAIPVSVVGAPTERLPSQVELAAFFFVCEALANVSKHARATSAAVQLRRGPSDLVVEVTDDGIGGATPDGGTGLRGLADRVETLGGRLRVWSPPGEGTRLRAEIPCG